MKTLRFVFGGLICAALLVGCNKSEWQGNEPGKDNLKAARVIETVISVGVPNGVNDTEALVAAFAEAAGQLNPVVQLEEGVYHLDFVEIREFYGTFRGMGKGKSVITTVEDLNVDALISQNLNTILIRFVGGDVRMNNMTIMTPPGALSTGSENKIDGLTGFSAFTILDRSADNFMNAVIDNVEFIGQVDNCGYGLKAEFGIRSGIKVTGGYPLSKTNITITNCLFENFYYSGALIWHIKDGKILVGKQNNGNVFNNIVSYHTSSSVGYGSLGIWMNVNVEISVVDNTFNLDYARNFGVDLWRAPYPAFLEQVPQSKITLCKIERNVFNVTGGAGGIKMNDRRRYFSPAEAPMLVEVKNNLFNMTDQADVGIECVCMSGTVIRNNRFTGAGSRGVLINTDGFFSEGKLNYCENGLMLGNNFSNATYSDATVRLDSKSRNWTIVGGNLGETIIDEGENNLITGMNINTSGVPLGQTIVDNFDELK